MTFKIIFKDQRPVVTFQISIVHFLSPVVTFAILLSRKFQPVVSLENQDWGSGPLFQVVDPGVHYQGPLPSPILTVQALLLRAVFLYFHGQKIAKFTKKILVQCESPKGTCIVNANCQFSHWVPLGLVLFSGFYRKGPALINVYFQFSQQSHTN